MTRRRLSTIRDASDGAAPLPISAMIDPERETCAPEYAWLAIARVTWAGERFTEGGVA